MVSHGGQGEPFVDWPDPQCTAVLRVINQLRACRPRTSRRTHHSSRDSPTTPADTVNSVSPQLSARGKSGSHGSLQSLHHTLSACI